MRDKFLLLIFVLSTQACSQKEKHMEYHANGQLALEGQRTRGKKVGEWIEYDSLGNKTSLMKYQEDTLIYRELYVQGRLLASEEMRGDKKHGKTIEYYENGEKKGEMAFKNGIQKGEQFFFDKKGRLTSKYIEKGDGEVTEYHQYFHNGQLNIYAKNLISGEFNIYDSLGNRTYDLLYRNAELIDTLKVY